MDDKSWHFIGVKAVVWDNNKKAPVYTLDNGKVMMPHYEWAQDEMLLVWKEEPESMLNEVEDYLEKMKYNLPGHDETMAGLDNLTVSRECSKCGKTWFEEQP